MKVEMRQYRITNTEDATSLLVIPETEEEKADFDALGPLDTPLVAELHLADGYGEYYLMVKGQVGYHPPKAQKGSEAAAPKAGRNKYLLVDLGPRRKKHIVWHKAPFHTYALCGMVFERDKVLSRTPLEPNAILPPTVCVGCAGQLVTMRDLDAKEAG